MEAKPLYSTKKLLLPAIFVLSLFLVTWYRRPSTTAYYGEAMGTTWSVQLADDPRENLQAVIQKELNIVNVKMSTYQPDSEVSRFNRHDTQSFNISSDTALVIQTALDLHQKSLQAFDITIGPVVNAWGFGFPPSLKTPTEESLETLKQSIGSDKLTLHNTTLTKSNPDTKIDLSAIAKGYAVDAVSNALVQSGYQNFLVEVGGEIYTRGTKSGNPWLVGIEQPKENQGAIQLVLPLQDAALATSGDYRNYKEKNGVRYSHTIDPRTLKPIAHNLASISVIAPTVMEADGWATALNVLGEEEALRLAEKYDLGLYMLLREEDGTFRSRSNAYFAELLNNEAINTNYGN